MFIQQLHVHCQWEEEKGFTIWATTEDDDYLDIDHWQNKLFSWHESSFYGSFIEIVEHNNRLAILLSPWQALDFFANTPTNTLLTITYREPCIEYQYIAKQLFQAIKDEEFMPDYEQWVNGELGWKVTDATAPLGSFAKQWLNAALSDWFNRDKELASTWHEITKAFPLLHAPGDPHATVDEDGWLEKIGWNKDETPFQILLRLEEPDNDEDAWMLQTILRDKHDETNWLVFQDNLPSKWRDFSHRIEREHRIWTTLVPWLQKGDGIVCEISENEAWQFLTEDSTHLLNAGVEIQLPSWWQAIKDAELAVKAKVKSSGTGTRRSFVGLQSIIDFDWRFSTNGVDLSEDEFMSLVDQKRRLVNVRGKWIKLDPAFIKQVQSIMSKANKEGLSFRSVLEQELLKGETNSNVGLVQEGDAFARVQIQLNRHLSRMLNQLTDSKDIPQNDIPSSFKGNLRPYQQKGVDWLLFLRQFGFGACLADDMGLGKTIQMIAYFLTVKEKGSKPSLIICPTSVLGNWQKELEKFGPSLNVYLHYGPNRAKGDDFQKAIEHSDIVLTSYGLSHLDNEEIQEAAWGTICLDEAQNIKNAQTKQSRAIRNFQGDHHIALTGTPMENRLTELWSIFDFINGGYLGSLGQFQKRFVTPIEKDRDTEKIEQVQRLIRPFLLRRTKKDEDVALNLPDKQEQKEYCPLTVEQASLYEQLVKDTFDQVEQLDGIARKGLILKMLGQLKQVCNHPSLYLKEEQPRDIDTRSTKMEKLLELVTNIREHDESCLIFTQYITMGEMIRHVLQQQFNEEVLFLNGSLTKSARDEMIASFQDRKYNILILSLKAGGTGLNLTEANHVIHYDRWWNPAVENQATDRAYRIGQKRFVHVHKLISTGTLEEKIDDMLEQKQALNDEIIQSENWITELSTNDLKDLLTLRS